MTDIRDTHPQAAFGALKYEVDAYLWRVAQFSAGWIDKRTLLDAGTDLLLAMERMERAMNGVKK